MKQQDPDFVNPPQEITDQELLEMPAEEVNEILFTMTPEEAFDFLGHLGRLRAAQIYNE